MLKTIKPKGKIVFLYLCVPVAIYLFTIFIPLLAAGFYSLFEWKGGPQKSFIGLDNYVKLIGDATFWESFSHNIYLVLICAICQIGLALIFVLFINSKLVKFKGLHRTLAFFPSTISAVAIGFIWMMIYDYRRGILNWFLEVIGKDNLKKVWLNEPDLVMLLIAIPVVWQYIGYYMVILLSAIASIDSSVLEVAELDGANAFQRTRYIILPLIRNTLLVCITLCIAGNMKAFDHIYVMTSGGPGTSSMVMALYGYKVSFDHMNMGYGSTISMGIFILSLALILCVNKIAKKMSRGE